MRKSKVMALVAAVSLALSLLSMPSFALAEDSSSSTSGSTSEVQRYYIGSAMSSETNSGYTKLTEITEDDPHFGWRIGQFSITGFTREVDGNDSPVFLKNLGDTVTLCFSLNQDINCLNGNDSLSVSDDTDGYDTLLGVQKIGFGKGNLIVRKTDYQNNAGDSQSYTNFLSAEQGQDANTEIELFEEGDYEVALDYEIRNDHWKVPGIGFSILPKYTNYSIRFEFKVRNGNCMVYPFDLETGSELSDKAFTDAGFRLDLAKSRYLNIQIKRMVLNDEGTDLTEDTRFSQPARDGEEFTQEGIYEFTVSNQYTGDEVTKTIYVGDNDVLKAYVTTGKPIKDIQGMIDEGSTVAEDGTIVAPTGETQAAALPQTTDNDVSDAVSESTSLIENEPQAASNNQSTTGMVVLLIAIAAAATLVFLRQSKKKNSKENDPTESNPER